MASAPSAQKKSEGYTDILSRGGIAEWRLSFQHFITTQQQGFLIHPKVEKEILRYEKPTIADLSTGNGVWALDVAAIHPNAEIVGSDITDKQFPAPALQMRNTKFELHNMFDEAPERYREAFDMVHLRLTVAWIHRQDKDLLVRNVLSMLKPGGLLQWSEVSYPPILIHEPNGEVHPGSPKSWLRVWKIAKILPTFEWLAQLGEILPSQYGLIETGVHRPKPNGAVLLYHKQLLEWTMQEFYEVVVKAGMPGAEDEYALSLDEQDQDYNAGKQFAYNWQTLIARKPFHANTRTD